MSVQRWAWVDGGLDTDEMVARADSALYAAKEGGRDRVCIGGGDGDPAST